MKISTKNIELQEFAFSSIYGGLLSGAVEEVVSCREFCFIKKYYEINSDAIYNSAMHLCQELEDISINGLSSVWNQDNDLKQMLFLNDFDESVSSFNLCSARLLNLNIDNLLEYLNIRTQYWIESLKLLFSRLISDKKIIEKSFLPPIGQSHVRAIEEITTGFSDSHDGGKTVVKILIDNTAIYYKPRDCEPEICLNNFIDRISSFGLPTHLPKLNIVNCDNYAWTLGLVKKQISSSAQADEYHYSAGSLLCISWLLGTTDLHHENIFASPQGPVIIDAEGIMQPSLSIRQSRIWEILRTGLIGLYLSRNGNAISHDLSGFHMKLFLTKSNCRIILKNNTKDMQIFNRVTYKSNIRDNALQHASGVVEGVKHINPFLSGFVDTHNFLRSWLATHSKNNLSEIFSPDLKSRIFLRPTRAYMDLRNQYIYRLVGLRDNIKKHNRIDLSIRGIEREQIKNGDIPVFYAKAGQRSLLAGQDTKYQNFFSKSALVSFQERITRGSIFLKSARDLIPALIKIIGQH